MNVKKSLRPLRGRKWRRWNPILARINFLICTCTGVGRRDTAGGSLWGAFAKRPQTRLEERVCPFVRSVASFHSTTESGNSKSNKLD
eukprot:3088976-Prymnesium_polylepis.1